MKEKRARRKIKENGYVLIKDRESGYKWVLEHIRVVERFLGTKLVSGEVIHHINGNRKDNRIKNLMLFKSQKEHKSFENKVKQFGFTKPILREIELRWERFK